MARILSVIAACLLLSAVGGASLLAPAQPRPGYAGQVAQLCRTTNAASDAYPGSYYHAVAAFSEQRADVLRSLRPPSSLAGVHRELLVREARLARIAGRAMGRAAAAGTGAVAVQLLPRMRTEQAALSVAYRSLRVSRCSTSVAGTAPARTIDQAAEPS